MIFFLDGVVLMFGRQLSCIKRIQSTSHLRYYCAGFQFVTHLIQAVNENLKLFCWFLFSAHDVIAVFFDDFAPVFGKALHFGKSLCIPVANKNGKVTSQLWPRAFSKIQTSRRIYPVFIGHLEWYAIGRIAPQFSFFGKRFNKLFQTLTLQLIQIMIFGEQRRILLCFIQGIFQLVTNKRRDRKVTSQLREENIKKKTYYSDWPNLHTMNIN